MVFRYGFYIQYSTVQYSVSRAGDGIQIRFLRIFLPGQRGEINASAAAAAESSNLHQQYEMERGVIVLFVVFHRAKLKNNNPITDCHSLLKKKYEG